MRNLPLSSELLIIKLLHVIMCLKGLNWLLKRLGFPLPTSPLSRLVAQWLLIADLCHDLIEVSSSSVSFLIALGRYVGSINVQ